LETFRTDETFPVLVTDPDTGAPVEATCVILGVDEGEVMVTLTYPKGYLLKKFFSKEDLEQAKLQACKLFKSLA
jgi:hypothetical protein